ncbi:MAG TPA: hypothetical protein VLX30_02755 [Burkholderiales bacterium]|nr:hypothetical protein [Burkholderiales bacterium]
MHARDDKLTRSAFWCEVLNGDARPLAVGAAVRTVRGAYTASRPPELKRTGESSKPPSWPRRA